METAGYGKVLCLMVGTVIAAGCTPAWIPDTEKIQYAVVQDRAAAIKLAQRNATSWDAALGYAAYVGDLDLVQTLLRIPVPPLRGAPAGVKIALPMDTILMNGAVGGHFAIVKYALLNGANPLTTAHDSFGLTNTELSSSDIAIEYGHYDLASYLINQGIQRRVADSVIRIERVNELRRMDEYVTSQPMFQAQYGMGPVPPITQDLIAALKKADQQTTTNAQNATWSAQAAAAPSANSSNNGKSGDAHYCVRPNGHGPNVGMPRPFTAQLEDTCTEDINVAWCAKWTKSPDPKWTCGWAGMTPTSGHPIYTLDQYVVDCDSADCSDWSFEWDAVYLGPNARKPIAPHANEAKIAR